MMIIIARRKMEGEEETDENSGGGEMRDEEGATRCGKMATCGCVIRFGMRQVAGRRIG